jgi:tetratricopeptide (TPR) repeat protein
VVLTWGRSPADLDLHATFPDNHVFFDHKLGRDANLDVDDTDGSGPETITIERKAFGQPYLFAVHDYTNREHPERAGLAESSARVFVYVGQTLIRRYEVPTRKQGTLWTVFFLDGQGEFHDVDTITPAAMDPMGELFTTLTTKAGAAPVVAMARVEPVSVSATGLNAEGERAYHAGRIDDSIEFYRRAIEASPEYGQAWSNLGLSYRKSNRIAEAVGSRQKAFQLVQADPKLVRFYLPLVPKDPELPVWSLIRQLTEQIGEGVTTQMRAIARENPRLQGIIDRVDFNATTHGQRDLDDDRLSNLIEAISSKRLGLNDVEADIIGKSYEYLIRKFAEGSGQSAGEFYTPPAAGEIISKVLQPEPGMEIYDPCCGSGGLLVK